MKSLSTEMTIIRHLYTKITPEMMEYRPHEKQRSMLELMNYLGHIFDNAASMIIAGSSDGYKELFENAPKVTFENFDSIMDAQDKLVTAKIEAMTDGDLSSEVEIFYRKDSRAMHLLNILKWATAYKMQLFLYIKANGNHDISTSNLWGGMDMPPKN